LIAQDGMLKYVNPATLALLGYSEEELLSRPFAQLIHAEDREKLMEAHAKRMRGEETEPVKQFRALCKDGAVKWADSHAVLIVWNGRAATLNFFTDITERKKAEASLAESFAQLRSALGATVQAIAVTVETRDPYTAGHQRRVADLARSIAREMNLSRDQIEGIRTAAIIHDLGKISVPAEILSKPAKLTDIEFSLIKTHPQSGYDILKDIEFPWPVARMVLEHHERMDGSGYPNGLKGDQTLLESRILSVADVVEAMASHRPYRPSLGIEAALEEIEKNREILYDGKVVDACLRLFREKKFHFSGHDLQR
jgi:PAS domain S-box-containing protein